MNTFLPLISGLLSVVFAGFLLVRFSARKGMHLLVWSFGMLLYALGGLCEAYSGAFGWNALAFRLWYLCGAFLSAAWLGQGTLFLLARRTWWVAVLASLLVLGSAYAVVKVFGAQLDPIPTGAAAALSGRVIVSGGVRSLTPIFNIYGTLALVGGAIWSAVTFARKRVLPHRMIGNILIAVGALMPAIGGSLSRLGSESLLYTSELLGTLLMFVGFLFSTLAKDRTPGEESTGLPGTSARGGER
jgi:hypothetical protein